MEPGQAGASAVNALVVPRDGLACPQVGFELCSPMLVDGSPVTEPSVLSECTARG